MINWNVEGVNDWNLFDKFLTMFGIASLFSFYYCLLLLVYGKPFFFFLIDILNCA